MRIALDAMGGDFGPAVVVEGAVVAAREHGVASVLVGDKAAIEREIVRLKAQELPLSIRHASQVVSMAESPVQALRPQARLVAPGGRRPREGRRVPGPRLRRQYRGRHGHRDVRPRLAPRRRASRHRHHAASLAGYTVLIDSGANVDPKPRHLFQFAVMGHVYSRDIIGKDHPRVGLLSVGEEEGKGNELVKDTFESLRGSSLNFIGNVEGPRHLQRSL
jgi:glycerol-3-phosphate acyltransferase PlsX